MDAASELAPLSPAEEDERLGGEITLLAGQINAANYRLLTLIAAFDDRRAWGAGGTVRSCAHWLNWRCGIALGAAREKVRVAHCLQELPLISGAFEKGEISYSKVRAMTRVATPENEDFLLTLARYGTASHVEQSVARYRRVKSRCGVQAERQQRDARELVHYQDDDGMWVIHARLPAETGSLVVKAIESIVEPIFEQRRRVQMEERQRERERELQGERERELPGGSIDKPVADGAAKYYPKNAWVPEISEKWSEPQDSLTEWDLAIEDPTSESTAEITANTVSAEIDTDDDRAYDKSTGNDKELHSESRGPAKPFDTAVENPADGVSAETFSTEFGTGDYPACDKSTGEGCETPSANRVSAETFSTDAAAGEHCPRDKSMGGGSEAHPESPVPAAFSDTDIENPAKDVSAETFSAEVAASDDCPRHDTHAQVRADALVAIAEHFLASAGENDENTQYQGLKGSERCQVMLHVDVDTLKKHTTADGTGLKHCNLDEESWVSAATARRLACDASLVTVLEDGEGNVLNIGRKSRTVPTGIKRALAIRDKTCRFPGCCESRYVDAHHIRHWADGGETSLNNLVHLCRFHHAQLHRGAFEIQLEKSVSAETSPQLVFTTPPGNTIESDLYPQFDPAAVATSEQALLDLAPDVDFMTAVTQWSGERCNYGMVIEALMVRDGLFS